MSSLKRFLIATSLVLFMAAAYLGYRIVGPGRYAEFEGIQSRLREIPGVTLLDASGHEDVTFEIDSFTIAATGRGVIEFGALNRQSFESTDHLHLYSIGGHRVIVVTEGFIGVTQIDTGEPMTSTGWSHGIDVGPQGPFSSSFPFPLHNVQSVLDHYEEICAELTTWPTQPEYSTFQDRVGTKYFYARKDPSSDEEWIHPQELIDR